MLFNVVVCLGDISKCILKSSIAEAICKSVPVSVFAGSAVGRLIWIYGATFDFAQMS